MSNKTPFEVRLEVLKMAKELAMEKHYDRRSTQMEQSRWNEENGSDVTFVDIQTPSISDIIKNAEELNKFVSEAGTGNKKQLLNE